MNLEKDNFDIFNSLSKIKRLRYIFSKKQKLLINMELRNGQFDMFIIYLKKNNSFIYKDAEYIIDDDLKYYVKSCKLYCLDYHQDITMPIKRKIPKNLITKAVQQEGITDVETAINPLSMRAFIESEVIQKVMQGVNLDKSLRMLKIVSMITLIICVILLLVFIQWSGILQGLNVPLIS